MRRTGPGRARPRALAAVLAVALAVAGCSGLPTDAAVRSPDSDAAARVDGRVLFLPPPPAEGANPEEVVEGFLLAQGGDDPDHAVARQYLTPRAASTWDDDAGIVTYDDTDGGPDVEEVDVPAVGDPRLSLDVAVDTTGRVSADGAYAPAAGVATEAFELVRLDGEWRLDRVPDGLWLPSRTAALVLTRVLPYFLAPLAPHVAPDPRYLPQAADLPDRVVDLVLDGPSDRLAPAVGTAAADVEQRVPVVVEDGTATVDLVGVDDLAPEERDALAAQIAWSLIDSPLLVTAVRLLAGGQPVALGPDASPAALERDSPLLRRTDPDVLPSEDDLLLLAVDGPSLRTFQGRGSGARRDVPLAEPVRHPALPLEETGLALGDDTVVALAGDVTADERTGTRLVRTSLAGGPVQTVLEAPSLSRPAFDPVTGLVWTVRSSGAGATGEQAVLLVDAASGDVRRVVADELLAEGEVLFVRPSRDGSRLLALVRAVGPEGEESTRVVVALLVRGSEVGEDDRSVSVAGPRDLSASATDVPAGVTDAAWASGDRLALLATDGPLLNAQPVLVPVEGADAIRLPSDRPLAGPRVALTAASSDATGADLVLQVGSEMGPQLFRGGRGDVYSRVGPGQDPTFRG